MIDLKTDLFHPNFFNTLDAVCFTSNGIVKSNGHLVMGAGVAKEFANRWPHLPIHFGDLVKAGGNRVHTTAHTLSHNPLIISFPTKHHWRNPSDLKLIIKSANELVEVANRMGLKHIALPRPGVGLGGLSWESQVKPAIKDLLDDRFYVVFR